MRGIVNESQADLASAWVGTHHTMRHIREQIIIVAAERLRGKLRIGGA